MNGMAISERFLLLDIIGCSEWPAAPNATTNSASPIASRPNENDSHVNATPAADAAAGAEEASSSLMNTAVLTTTFLLSCLNVLSNLASLLVFAHWKKRPVVQLLIFLCAAETLFNLGYSSLYARAKSSSTLLLYLYACLPLGLYWLT